MGKTKTLSLTLFDYNPPQDCFREAVLSGLQKTPKQIPCKYFYDEKGARLFEEICKLDEYYIPRCEAQIMKRHIADITGMIGPQICLIEYGCGDCKKVQFMLDHLEVPLIFIPIDISKKQLIEVTDNLVFEYPEIEILPVCADYTHNFKLPDYKSNVKKRVIYFPGSTIGNFDPPAALQFLQHMADTCQRGGVLIIGVDLKKDPIVLHNAYNDSKGVTAAFNLNILQHINREMEADFNPHFFKHYAFYNPLFGRIEMHLISLREQIIHIDNKSIKIAEGESIHTESSYKYTLAEFAHLAARAGFEVKQVWTDNREWFSVQYLINTNS